MVALWSISQPQVDICSHPLQSSGIIWKSRCEGKHVSIEGMVECRLTVSFKTEIFHSEENFLNRNINNSKSLQEVPETDQIHKASPCQSKQQKAESHSQTSQGVKKIQSKNSFSEETETHQSSWKRFRPTSCGKDTHQPDLYLQAVLRSRLTTL